jgi:tetratricopeptide (TPR) repeat protein
MTSRRADRRRTDELEPVEVAEGIWLAAHVYPSDRSASPAAGPAPKRSAGSSVETPAEPPLPDRSPASPVTRSEPEQRSTSPLVSVSTTQPSRSGSLVAAHIEVAPSELDEAGRRSLSRALRPLKRPVPSPVDLVFDEEATAVHAAEQQLWVPELVPAPMRPFDVVLVLDDSPSMRIWRPEVAKFHRLLERQGAFRNVQTTRIDTDQCTVQDLRGLANPRGRVVLLLTDGVGRGWRTGAIQRQLDRLSRSSPVAVVQVLPSDMWSSWSAMVTHPASWRAPMPRRPSHEWRCQRRDDWIPDAEPVRVPVLELSGLWFARWVDLVTDGGADRVELPALDRRGQESAGPPERVSNGDPSRWMQRFRKIATPTAFQLAVLLAAAPLSLETIRTVQSELLPMSTTAHLAEVFLGGLLYPVETDGESRSARVEFDFLPGLRSELLAVGTRAQTAAVLRHVSNRLGSRIRAVKYWRDVLAHPGSAPMPDHSPDSSPFLQVQYPAMVALGGPYATWASHLKSAISANGPLNSSISIGMLEQDGNQAVGDISSEAQPSVGTTETDMLGGSYADREADDMTALEHDNNVATPIQKSAASQSPPAVWGAVPLRNVNFTGRDWLLDELHTRLNRDEATAVLPEALHGLGGIGKSQIAIEFVYRHAQEYDLVWWISSEDVDQIKSAYVDLCVRLGLRSEPGADTAVPAVMEALRTGSPYRRWLLVFDNADDPESVRPYFPQGSGHVLVTSRNARWAGVGSSLAVDVFTRDESKSLLQRRNPDLPDSDADRLAEVLGDLPLAVDQAAAWRAETGMSADDYLELFEDKLAELGDISPPPTDYPLTVAAAWTVSLDRLHERHPAALALLQVCSFFAAEPIARKLFTGVRNLQLPPEVAKALATPVQLSAAIREINRYSLAKIDHRRDTIQLHRLVQKVLRSQMGADQQHEMQGVAQQLLANGDPELPEDINEWPRYQEMLPHVRACRVVESDDPWVRQFAINMANFLFAWGDPERARRLASDMAREWSVRLGADHLDTLIAERWHGRALRALGRYDESTQIAKATLKQLSDTLGDDHEETLRTAYGVASDLRAKGEFDQARAINKDSYERAFRAFGQDDPETLRAANNYALSLRLTGDLQAARDLDGDTYQRRIIVLGDDHRFTLLSMDNLSVDQRECGEYVEACRIQEATVRRFQEIVGSHRSLTLAAMKNLAVAKRKAGDHEEARVLSEEAYRQLKDRYGERHPDTMSAAMNYSVALRQVGQLKEARKLGEQVWSLYKDTMGEHHPFSLAGATNLAVALRLLNQLDEARKLDEDALPRFESALGPEHFFTLVCATNLASDLHAARDYQAAYDLDVVSRERSARTLGDDHPSTLAVDLNLVLDLRGLGNHARADELQRDTVARFKKKLGPTHPATISALNAVRADCDIDPMQI